VPPIHYIKVLMNYFFYNSISRRRLQNKIRNLCVEKMSFGDSASTTKPFAYFHEILRRNSLQKLVGNYEFVKTVSVEAIFYLRAYKLFLAVISIFIKRFECNFV
jgi:hypothetical protein